MRLGQRDRRYAARRADYQTMVQCFPAMERLPVTKLVRVPWNEPGIISKVLDGGTYGVIWLMVNPREEALALVSYCRCPPKGAAQQWADPRRHVWRGGRLSKRPRTTRSSSFQ
jgi:2-keto-3-deoxy-L-rhamnonate aldolase RhmA